MPILDSLFSWLDGSNRQPRVPETIFDPVFVELMRSADDEWEGCENDAFAAEDVTILVEAGDDGPSERQRRLYVAIKERYSELEPAIHERLARTWPHLATASLSLLSINIGHRGRSWTAQYASIDGEENDMGYFADIARWRVTGVTAVD